MSRAITDRIKKAVSTGFRVAFGFEPYQDDVRSSGIRGDVFFDIRDAVTGETIEKRHLENVVTKDMSILLARLCAGEATNGIVALAVGTGDPSWDPNHPLPAGEAQRTLEAEVFRKKIKPVEFIDQASNPTGGRPTNVVDFTTEFEAGEAAAALTEMGLVGGDADDAFPPATSPIANGEDYDTSDVTDLDTLCNYLTFPVINKPSSAVMTVVWRLTF